MKKIDTKMGDGRWKIGVGRLELEARSWEFGDFVQIENSKFQSIKLEFGIFLLEFYF